MSRFDSQKLDREILNALASWDGVATYVIRNRVDSFMHSGWRGLRTSHVLTACRRLEKRGHVSEAPTSYAVMKTWRITESGRSTLSPEQKP